jgi:hypothetical protein
MKSIYILRAKFDKKLFIPFAYKIIAKDKIEIKFKNKLAFDEIKREIKNHYEKNNGEIEPFGKILYYEWYEDENLFYKFDINGNLIESTKFASPEFKEIYNKIFKIIKKAINEIDPFNLSWINKNIYNNEIKKLSKYIANEKFDQEEIFKAIKKVFDTPKFNYKKNENSSKYKEIAKKIHNEILQIKFS